MIERIYGRYGNKDKKLRHNGDCHIWRLLDDLKFIGWNKAQEICPHFIEDMKKSENNIRDIEQKKIIENMKKNGWEERKE